MAYEYLKKLFKTGEDGAAVPMSFEELVAAIEADDKLKLVNLADGGFVSKDKLDTKIIELGDTKQLLEDANATIQSYKDMDIDGIKKSASDWEEKYNTDTKALQDKLDAQATEFAAEKYMGQYQFTSPLAAKAAMAEFMEQGFKRSDDGTFLGADDFMAKMKESNPGAFVVEMPSTDPNPPAPPKPTFTPPNPVNPPKSNKRRMSLTEMMRYKAEHPDTDVNSLFEE